MKRKEKNIIIRRPQNCSFTVLEDVGLIECKEKSQQRKRFPNRRRKKNKEFNMRC
jgi:hypothetical protein